MRQMCLQTFLHRKERRETTWPRFTGVYFVLTNSPNERDKEPLSLTEPSGRHVRCSGFSFQPQQATGKKNRKERRNSTQFGFESVLVGGDWRDGLIVAPSDDRIHSPAPTKGASQLPVTPVQPPWVPELTINSHKLTRHIHINK